MHDMMHHLPDGPQVFTSYTIWGDVSPPWCKCIVCRACVQPVCRSWLHACLQAASGRCTLLTLSILSFVHVFSISTLPALRFCWGIHCPCCLGVKVGLHARRLFCAFLRSNKKMKKKNAQNFLKKIIHVIWPWRRIKKNNNSKKKYPVSKP